MAVVNDDVKEDSVTSAVSESVHFSLGEVALSLRDLTWADSCLINDVNDDMVSPKPDRNSIKVALSEIFYSQSVEDDSVEAKNNMSTRRSNSEGNSFRDYIASLTIGSESDEEEDLKENDIGDIESLQISDNEVDDPTVANRRLRVRGKRHIESVFRPNYTEDIVKAESNENGADLVNAQLSIGDALTFRDYVASLTIGSGSDEEEDLKEDDIGDFRSLQILDNDVDDHVIANRRSKAKGKRRIKNVAGPNYTKNIVKAESNENGTDLSSTTQEVESSPEDIFKVWDLGIPDEQDDFTKQLNKALDEGPLPINPNDSTAWVEVLKVSVDDLISGIGDLSLKQNTE
ncbi:hypothetical protein vseg_012700 [Gypsophila vaccaria]